MTLRKGALAISAFICVGYLIVGLSPFNFHPRNRVEWLRRRPGIHIKRNSIVYGELPAPPGNACTLELFVQPDKEPARGQQALLSFYDREGMARLILTQWKSTLMLRSGPNMRQTGTAGLSAGRAHFVAVVAGESSTTLSIDGPAGEHSSALSVLGDLHGPVIIGNSPDGRASWEGNVYGLALFSRRLTGQELSRHRRLWEKGRPESLANDPDTIALYLFNENAGGIVSDHYGSARALSIPAYYHVIRKAVLLPPWKDGLHFVDITINVAGFIPFGFAFFMYRTLKAPGKTRRNLFITAVLAGFISLTIELLQVYLPTRSSSLTDLMCNIAGSVIGASIAYGTARVSKLALGI